MDREKIKTQFDKWLDIIKSPNGYLHYSQHSLDFKIKDPEIMEPLFNGVDISFLSKNQANQILLSPYFNDNIYIYWGQKNPKLYATFKSEDNNLGTRLSALLNLDAYRSQDILRHIVRTLMHTNEFERILSEGSVAEQKKYFSTYFHSLISDRANNTLKYITPTKTLVNLMKAVQLDIAEAAKLGHETPAENAFKDSLNTIHNLQKKFNETVTPMIGVIEKGLNHTLEPSDFNALGEAIFRFPITLRPLNEILHYAAKSPDDFNKISPLINKLIKDYTESEITNASAEIRNYIISKGNTKTTALQKILAGCISPDNREIISIITDTTLPNAYSTLIDHKVADLVGLNMPIDYIINATKKHHTYNDSPHPFMRHSDSDPKRFWDDLNTFKNEIGKITDAIVYRHYLRTKEFDLDAPESDACTRLMIKEIADCIYGLGLREVFNAYIKESEQTGKNIDKITDTNPIPMISTGILASKYWLKKSCLDELTKETPHGRTLFDDIYLINDFAKQIAPHISIKKNMKPLLSIDNRVERIMSQILKKTTQNYTKDKDIDVNKMFENTL